MKSIFLKLYQQLLLSLILVSLITYFGIMLINHWRLSHHIEEISKGSIILIAQALSRHEGNDQRAWLDAATRITNLDLKIDTNSVKDDYFYTKSPLFEKHINLSHRIGDSDHFVSAKIYDMNEGLARTTALLILNDLGLTKKETRTKKLQNLQKYFSYPIKKVEKKSLNLSAAQLRRLERGDIFVKLDNSNAQQRYIKVLAPYGRTNELLSIGPIPLFNWYPQSFIISAILIMLIIIIIIGIYLVRPLETRLEALLENVDKIGLNEHRKLITITGNDGLNALANKINNMSFRIDTLMKNQLELTHAVSHELKTPIARLRFRLALLETAGSDEDRKNRILGMTRDISALNGLVDEILKLAKLQVDQNPITIKPVSINKLFEELSKDIELLNNTKEISFKSSISKIHADSAYLKHAILNLLTNAIRHASKSISVSAIQENDFFHFIIEDDGPGIEEKDRDHIFEPFSRLENSRNKKFGGYGLGLSITQKLVRWHQGKVLISDSDLGGARFTITVPTNLMANTQKERDNSLTPVIPSDSTVGIQ